MEAAVLRRVENLAITHSPGVFTGRGWVVVTIGRTSYQTIKIHKSEYAELLQRQYQYPTLVVRVGERAYWQFRGKFYSDNDGLSDGQVFALLTTREQREIQRIERAQAMVAMRGRRQGRGRSSVPDDVKQMVWMRDGGRCRSCGSDSELQFDHIIPVVMGGGSAPENLQVLCGPCNRRKGAGLTSG